MRDRARRRRGRRRGPAPAPRPRSRSRTRFTLAEPGRQALERDVDPAVRVAAVVLEEHRAAPRRHERPDRDRRRRRSRRLRRRAPAGSAPTAAAREAAARRRCAAARRPPSRAARRRSRKPSLSKSKRSGDSRATERLRGARNVPSPRFSGDEGAAVAGPDEVEAPVAVEIAGRGRPGSLPRPAGPPSRTREPPAPQVVVAARSRPPARASEQVDVAVAVEVRGDRRARGDAPAEARPPPSRRSTSRRGCCAGGGRRPGRAT